jgi:adenylate kinase family enzyme
MSRRQIVIYGVTGSGKTTLGKRLASLLGLRHIELDSLYHGPGWTPTPDDEFRARVEQAVHASPAGWVADGNYGAVRGFLLARADTVVWLRLPWRVSYLRMVWRSLSRAITRKELWNGNRESFRLLFMDRESLLLWGIMQHRPSQERIRKALTGTAHNAEVFEVKSNAELERLVARLARELNAGAGPLPAGS